jgi:beta,beta-carotene 9',10'-dioxygenase
MMKKVTADIEEELSSVPLTIQGNLPHWLSGTLVRNGPINVSANGEHLNHWFDGLAMLHAFTFEQGGVHYTNRFLRTDAYKTVFEAGSINYWGFANDPCRSLFKRLFTWLAPRSNHHLPNANINVAQIAKEYVALAETPLPINFDLNTLETLGVLDYQDHLPKEKCWESAHPHRFKDGTLNYLIQYGRKSHYVLYFVPDTAAERKIIAKIPVDEPAYMHSFAMTEHYVIFTEFPFVIRPLDLMIKGRPFIENFSWKPERGTRFIVVNRFDGSLVGQYRTKPFFAFHHVNAYETNTHIHLDLVSYPDVSIIHEVADYAQKPAKEHEHAKTRLERFTFSLDDSQFVSEILYEGALEFPRINGSYDGNPYRYVYLADARDQVSPPEDLRSLYKVDTQTKQALTWAEKGCYPGEPVFVASSEAAGEDSGVVLSVVFNPSQKISFLLILDASNFKEIGRAKAPHHIPPGLHGQFF